MMSLHFGAHAVIDFESAKACNNTLFGKFFHHMLEHGIYLPPSAFESWFISRSLSKDDIQQTMEAVKHFSID